MSGAPQSDAALALDASKRADLDVPLRVRDRHEALLLRVLTMMVAAGNAHKTPPVGLKPSDDLSA